MVKCKLHKESRNVTMSPVPQNRNFILTIRKFLSKETEYSTSHSVYYRKESKLTSIQYDQ